MYTAKIFGNRVKYIRTRLNVSQKELSDRIDMDDGSLRRIEAGRTNPTLSTICYISLAFAFQFTSSFFRVINWWIILINHSI